MSCDISRSRQIIRKEMVYMNRPMRKLLAFSAAAAMLANIPLMSVNDKYVAEQVGGKEFDTMIQYPDRNLYIENGTANYFDADPTIVRLIYVLLTFFTVFSGILLYPLLWIIMPEE